LSGEVFWGGKEKGEKDFRFWKELAGRQGVFGRQGLEKKKDLVGEKRAKAFGNRVLKSDEAR